ncbi:MAG: IBR domain-containing protein [Planctomycetes bacterium]|nr:IBR domain-containing protein [Planctomycetota bacterium]
MPDLALDAAAERAHCPGCGASLELAAQQALMTCRYCGTDCMVIRRLRRLDPHLPDGPPPKPPVDPSKDYAHWGTEALVGGILAGGELSEQIAMAKALDQWPHSNATMARLLPHYVSFMLTAPETLDHAMRGVIGKLICSKDLKLRNAAIVAGQRFGFAAPGSKGLLFALSLGDAGTVKLLLEIAEWAAENGLPDYCKHALYGVQTAIGREADYRHVCNEIVLNRLPYTTGQVQEWILNHMRLEFDVGYREPRLPVLHMIDDMATEKPELVARLEKAMGPQRSAESWSQWQQWLDDIGRLRHVQARRIAMQTLGQPPHDTDPGTIAPAVAKLEAWLETPELHEATVALLAGMLWLGNSVSPALHDLHQRRGAQMPPLWQQKYDLRTGR